MTCRDLDGFLAAYLDRELPARTRAAFDGHLAECPPCVEYLRAYETTIRLSRVVGREETAIDAVPAELIRAVLDARSAGAT